MHLFAEKRATLFVASVDMPFMSCHFSFFLFTSLNERSCIKLNTSSCLGAKKMVYSARSNRQISLSNRNKNPCPPCLHLLYDIFQVFPQDLQKPWKRNKNYWDKGVLTSPAQFKIWSRKLEKWLEEVEAERIQHCRCMIDTHFAAITAVLTSLSATKYCHRIVVSQRLVTL